MYTITLADGTRLEPLELNGNNYIADRVIGDSVFKEILAYHDFGWRELRDLPQHGSYSKQGHGRKLVVYLGRNNGKRRPSKPHWLPCPRCWPPTCLTGGR